MVYIVLHAWDSYERVLNVTWLFKVQGEGGSWGIHRWRETYLALLKPVEVLLSRVPLKSIHSYRRWIDRQLGRAGVGSFNDSQVMSLQILAGVFIGLTGVFLLKNCALGFVMACLAGLVIPLGLIHQRSQKRHAEVMRSLPEALELLSIGMEAGLDFSGALKVYIQKGPRGTLHAELSRVLQDVSTGKTRVEALNALLERLPFEFVSSPIGTVLQGLRLGASIAPILKSQAEQLRTARWEMVQKKSQEAPVKLLFPLLLFIFPTIFIVLFGPFVISLSQSGF